MHKRILQQGNKRSIYKASNGYCIFSTTAFIFLIPKHSFVRERNQKKIALLEIPTVKKQEFIIKPITKCRGDVHVPKGFQRTLLIFATIPRFQYEDDSFIMWQKTDTEKSKYFPFLH